MYKNTVESCIALLIYELAKTKKRCKIERFHLEALVYFLYHKPYEMIQSRFELKPGQAQKIIRETKNLFRPEFLAKIQNA